MDNLTSRTLKCQISLMIYRTTHHPSRVTDHPLEIAYDLKFTLL